MPIYRIVLDAYNSRDTKAKSARVVTYSQGWNRDAALAKLRTIQIGQDGTVSDGLTPWPGTNSLPDGPHEARSLPEWEVVAIRATKKSGHARILAE